MKNQFYIKFENGMPTGTAQQKGVYVRNGKPYFYTKDKVKSAGEQFTRGIKPYAPKTPSDKPIKLTLWFAFDTKDKKKWGQYKASRPDADNIVKLWKDCATGLLWNDDAQVVDLRVIKTYAEKASIMACYEELIEGRHDA